MTQIACSKLLPTCLLEENSHFSINFIKYPDSQQLLIKLSVGVVHRVADQLDPVLGRVVSLIVLAPLRVIIPLKCKISSSESTNIIYFNRKWRKAPLT